MKAGNATEGGAEMKLELTVNALKQAKFRGPAIEDSDIDAAKILTCIGHVLTSGNDVTDGAFFHTKNDVGGFQ